jgi:hypothetical protein
MTSALSQARQQAERIEKFAGQASGTIRES